MKFAGKIGKAVNGQGRKTLNKTFFKSYFL